MKAFCLLFALCCTGLAQAASPAVPAAAAATPYALENTEVRSHFYPNLKTRVRVFEDEDHASVFPFVLTHGLRAWLRRAR